VKFKFLYKKLDANYSSYLSVGFHASTVRQKITAEAQPTFILYLIPPTHLGLVLGNAPYSDSVLLRSAFGIALPPPN
jgi:hypothetical protein